MKRWILHTESSFVFICFRKGASSEDEKLIIDKLGQGQGKLDSSRDVRLRSQGNFRFVWVDCLHHGKFFFKILEDLYSSLISCHCIFCPLGETQKSAQGRKSCLQENWLCNWSNYLYSKVLQGNVFKRSKVPHRGNTGWQVLSLCFREKKAEFWKVFVFKTYYLSHSLLRRSEVQLCSVDN